MHKDRAETPPSGATSTSSGLAESVGATIVELGQIGADGPGVTRVAWSHELLRAYEWIGGCMRALGLDVETDAAGNLWGRWEVGSGQPVVVGSHLDTVPRAGRFDGALGVVAAVHAVRALQEEGFEPERPLWIVAFMDEEGTRFGTALFGSRAFAGEDLASLGDRADADGTTLREAMKAAGFDFGRIGEAARAGEAAAFLELHIEQGPVLEADGLDVGVVTSIVGLRGYRVRLQGEANHAGTTPMQLRRDAFVGAARIALTLRDVARERTAVTANVGKIAVEPGGANVVPGVAEFTIDVRATTAAGIAELERLVEETVTGVAAEEGLEADIEQTFALEPLELDPKIVDVVERAAAGVGARAKRLPSGAGHDAMVVGRHVPAAMVFVPSRRGISHSPEEHTSDEHAELGARVLAETLKTCLRRG